MANIISLNHQLEIIEITYEAGDLRVLAKCRVHLNDGGIINTTIQISHTDLNRIIGKAAAGGYEFSISQTSSIYLQDGTEIIDYSFENIFGHSIVLEDFDFMDEVRELRA